jgi:polyhydroxybutyrate depolymerase
LWFTQVKSMMVQMLARKLLILVLSCAALSGLRAASQVQAQSDEDANPSAGCASIVSVEAGPQDYELESGGLTRSYLVYVPDGFDASSPAPLVLTFHGFAGWPAQQMQNSNWRQVADENGFLVVYPSGTGLPLRWRIGQDFNNANDEIDDLQFISDLLDELSDQYCLDLNRIYANGLSNGGGMTYLLACDMADRFAAVGTVSGAYIEPEDGCQPSRPIPLITFHGTDDPIVPYEGLTSRSFNFPHIADWVSDWAARDGCDATPESLPDVGDVSGWNMAAAMRTSALCSTLSTAVGMPGRAQKNRCLSVRSAIPLRTSMPAPPCGTFFSSIAWRNDRLPGYLTVFACACHNASNSRLCATFSR